MFLKKRTDPFKDDEIPNGEEFVEKPSELIEKQFLDEYFLVVRRVQGIGLSLSDFWNMPLDTFAQILNNEREIMKAEQEEYEKQRLESKSKGKGKMTTPSVKDSDSYTDIYNELIE